MADKNICTTEILNSVTENTKVIVEENGELGRLNLYAELESRDEQIAQLNQNITDISGNIAFMTGTLSSTGEDAFLTALCREFLNTGKAHGFVYVIWENNDYFTGTLSRYATGSATGVIVRAGSAKGIIVKSNGETITKKTITSS